MKIVLNGETKSLPEPMALDGLLEALELAADRVAVELNRELVRRRDHATTRLADGDVVEIVTLVGGG